MGRAEWAGGEQFYLAGRVGESAVFGGWQIDSGRVE